MENESRRKEQWVAKERAWSWQWELNLTSSAAMKSSGVTLKAPVGSYRLRMSTSLTSLTMMCSCRMTTGSFFLLKGSMAGLPMSSNVFPAHITGPYLHTKLALFIFVSSSTRRNSYSTSMSWHTNDTGHRTQQFILFMVLQSKPFPPAHQFVKLKFTLRWQSHVLCTPPFQV